MSIPRPITSTVIVGQADTLLVGTNPRRRGLILSSLSTTGAVFIGVNGPATTTTGILLPPSSPPLLLWQSDWEGLARAEFHARLVGAAAAPVQTLPFVSQAAGAATTGAGVVLSKTPGVNVPAVLTNASFANITGGPPTVALQLIHGGVTTTLWSGTTQQNLALAVQLASGDTAQWSVITPAAASSADFTLGGTTQSFSGSTVTTVPVTVVELEG